MTLSVLFCLVLTVFSTLPIKAAKLLAPEITRFDMEKIVSGDGRGKYIIENGSVVTPEVPLFIDDTVRLTLFWSLSPEVMLTAQDGDFFEIELPTSHFTFVNSEAIDIMALIDASNSDFGTEVIGHWQILNGKIRVTLNNQGSQMSYIDNGKIAFYGKPNKLDNTFELIIGDMSFPSMSIRSQETFYEADKNQILSKGGAKIAGTEAIHWDIWVNQANAKKAFENQPTDAMRNIILTDDLEVGQTVRQINFIGALRNMTTEGKMATKSWRWNNISNQFQKITQTSTETYDEFYLRIVEKTQPSYGVFNGRRVIVNLTDLPGSGLKAFVDDSELLRFIDSAIASGYLPEGQRDAMFEIYRTAGTLNGEPMEILVKIIANPLAGNGGYHNSTTLQYNGGLSQTTAADFYYESLSGTATTGKIGDLVVRKKDGNSLQPLVGVLFKLQKFNNMTHTFEDYMDESGYLVKGTAKEGQVIFSKLKKGKYQLVEVENPIAGYSQQAFFPTGNQFEVTGYEISSIEIEVLNYLVQRDVELYVKDSQTELPLEGAVFELQTNAGVKIGEHHLTDKAGKINLTNLSQGAYQFVEIEAPSGYELDYSPIQFRIENQQISALQLVKYNKLLVSVEETTQTLPEEEVEITEKTTTPEEQKKDEKTIQPENNQGVDNSETVEENIIENGSEETIADMETTKIQDVGSAVEDGSQNNDWLYQKTFINETGSTNWVSEFLLFIKYNRVLFITTLFLILLIPFFLLYILLRKSKQLFKLNEYILFEKKQK